MKQRMCTIDQPGLGRLPLEIRRAIWKECLPEPATSPELYFYNRDDFGPDQVSTGNGAPGSHVRFKVVIDYPVILHVCHESRDEDNISDLWGIFDRQRNDPTGVFKQIRHLALGSWHFLDRHAYRFWFELLCTLHALRHVSIIFGSYWGFLEAASRYHNEMCEFRHFTLAPFTEEVAWMHPDFEALDDTEFAPLRVTDLIVDLEDALSTNEVVDEDYAPWNKDPGRWLFGFSAKKMVADPIESSPGLERFNSRDGLS
ncbi:hypothetical protein VMCG_10375 [Cytospora schulzeri]|uniref:2EXR domain-containing protein n=1 Tax=Cytospora schulzeri TaxID=448051 RepID=A0A423VC94_9PEZI|nr:hypothetical protein VMCG_10375 [Valsa malicola]